MQLRRCLAVLALSVVAGCGGSSGGSAAPSPSPTVDTVAAAKAEITTNWQTFFTAGGAVETHTAVLEDGAKFTPELTAFAKDPANKDLVAKVTAVDVTGDTAKVTYDLLGTGGTVLLGGSTGQAVKIGGHWLVSKQTYCQLIALQDPGKPHPACS